jgi:hypothetical protein
MPEAVFSFSLYPLPFLKSTNYPINELLLRSSRSEHTERRPLDRHEVQAASKVFRSRIVVKSSCPYRGIGNKIEIVKWFYKDRHVKELQKLEAIGEVP